MKKNTKSNCKELSLLKSTQIPLKSSADYTEILYTVIVIVFSQKIFSLDVNTVEHEINHSISHFNTCK